MFNILTISPAVIPATQKPYLLLQTQNLHHDRCGPCSGILQFSISHLPSLGWVRVAIQAQVQEMAGGQWRGRVTRAKNEIVVCTMGAEEDATIEKLTLKIRF